MDELTVFLDRDGVINVKAPEHEYISDYENFRFIKGAPDALARLSCAGARLIVVTNQRGIATGKISADAVNDIHRKMTAELAALGAIISKVYVCPHNVGECRCRKPETGLFEKADSDFCICRKLSWTVGDSLSDILAGKSFGTKTVFIGKDCGTADFVCGSLKEAADIILTENKERSK